MERSIPRPRLPRAWIAMGLLPALAVQAHSAPATRAMDELIGRVVAVLDCGHGAALPRDISLVIDEIDTEGTATGRRFHLEDASVIMIIEMAQHLLFADLAGDEVLARDIAVRFEDVVIQRRESDGRPRNIIASMGRVYPDHRSLPTGYEYRMINPGCPEPDFHRRYVRVPVIHGRPELGSFDLYYELCGDFDPDGPTVIVPTDGQRMLPQVGWTDRYRQIFDTSLNIVTYEYRGMPCSSIPGLEPGATDWSLAAMALHSDQVVEDIEMIRRDLLGDRKINILGGSGTAMIGLKYLARYHEHVEKAFLMSVLKDAQGSSEAGNRYLAQFLEIHDLERTLADIIASGIVASDQLLFLIQRLLYNDQEQVVHLLSALADGDLTHFEELTGRLGTVDHFLRSAQRYRPWTVVFMHETNLRTAAGTVFDINEPFFRMAEPLLQLAEQGGAVGPVFDVPDLEAITTEVLLVGGTLDQIAPIDEMMRILERLPNASFAVFEAYHCLDGPPESRQARNDLVDLFFLHGKDSPELLDYLSREGPGSRFLEIRPGR